MGVKIPEGPGWNGALYSNETNLIPIVTVDESGDPVDVENLQIEIYDVNWRWWWDRDEYDNLASYVGNQKPESDQKRPDQHGKWEGHVRNEF